MHSVLALEGRVSLAFGIGIGNATVATQDLPAHGASPTPPEALDTVAADERGALPPVSDSPHLRFKLRRHGFGTRAQL